MSLTIPTVKQEIKDLKEQRATIDRKIRALEDFLGGQGNGGAVSARRETDIRPVVEDLFKANGNQPLQVKTIVEEDSKRHPNMEKQIIEKKCSMLYELSSSRNRTENTVLKQRLFPCKSRKQNRTLGSACRPCRWAMTLSHHPHRKPFGMQSQVFYFKS